MLEAAGDVERQAIAQGRAQTGRNGPEMGVSALRECRRHQYGSADKADGHPGELGGRGPFAADPEMGNYRRDHRGQRVDDGGDAAGQMGLGHREQSKGDRLGDDAETGKLHP